MNDNKGPDPGIYRDVAFRDYQTWPCLNNSTLTNGKRSMRHLLHAMQNTREATSAMEFGTLCHAAILEPRYLHNRYCVMPDLAAGIRRPDGTRYDNVKATKEYKEKLAEWERMETRLCITQEQMTKAATIIENVHQHPLASKWLGVGNRDRPDTEICLVWDDAETGLRLKARFDAMWPSMREIVDVKTTADAMEFSKSIASFGYHRQAAFYLDGMAAIRGTQQYAAFRVIAVETVEPFCVRAAPMSDRAIATGRREYRNLLKQFAECVRTSTWPAYDDPDEWNLPGWYQNEPVSLTIDGQTVTVE